MTSSLILLLPLTTALHVNRVVILCITQESIPQPKGESKPLTSITPIEAEAHAVAERLLAQTKGAPPLQKDEKDAIGRAVTEYRDGAGLEAGEWFTLARLSARQLKRLNKSRLSARDRRVVKALEELKANRV
jgi:hypothetical protein